MSSCSADAKQTGLFAINRDFGCTPIGWRRPDRMGFKSGRIITTYELEITNGLRIHKNKFPVPSSQFQVTSSQFPIEPKIYVATIIKEELKDRYKMHFLKRIVEQKKREILQKTSEVPLSDLKEKLKLTGLKRRSLLKKMQNKPRFHFICEVKKASPSAGMIKKEVNPAQQARAYQAGGASAISVLTDGAFFKGSAGDLKQVRQAVQLPVLRKDFIIDAYQIYESALMGADLILLIVKILDAKEMDRLVKLATDLQLEILIELHEKDELARLPQNPGQYPVILGVNNRDLDTFEVNLNRSIDMRNDLPDELPLISESGIKSADDCLLLKAHGFQGALIGETLMRQVNPERFLREMVEVTNHVYAS